MNTQTRTEKGGGSGLGLVAAAFLLFCLGCLALSGTLFWKQFSIARSWPEIDGQVMRSDVVQIHLGTQTMYDTQLTFVYTLRGEPRVSTISTLHPTPEVEPQQSRAQQFIVGTHHRLQFNPKNPAQVRLRTESNLHSFMVPLWIGAAGLMFGIIAGAFFAASRPRTA